VAFHGINDLVRTVNPIGIAQLAAYAVAASNGIVIFQESMAEEKPLQRFTLGDAVSLARNTWQPARAVNLPELTPNQRWNVGTPHESIVPNTLRAAMDRSLRERHGVESPKVALVAVEASPGVLAVPYMLTPNLHIDDFLSPAEWQAALDRFSWFGPPEFPMIQPPRDRDAFDRWFRDVSPLIER